MHPALRLLSVSAVLTAAALPGQAAVVNWYASGGTTPDVAVPQWDLVDNASPENPSLAASVLTIGGSTISEQMYYSMDGADTDFLGQSSYWLEARLRVNTQSLTAGWWRAPVTMGIGFAGGGLAIFELRRDYVYLRDGDNSRGAFSNLLDTDDDFHTWRMEVLGSTAGSTVKIYQDGNLVLSDNSVFNYGSGNRVFWGDGSVIAGGRSEWTYVATNLAAAPASNPVSAPSSLALAGLGLLAVGQVATRCIRLRRVVVFRWSAWICAAKGCAGVRGRTRAVAAADRHSIRPHRAPPAASRARPSTEHQTTTPGRPGKGATRPHLKTPPARF